MLYLRLLSLLACPLVVHAVRQYVITNKCPQPITLFINGSSQGTLAANGGSTQRTFDNNFSGFIYSDANGGNKNGVGTTRAGFFGESSYYYIVVDSNHFNTGVQIDPIDIIPHMGFCGTITCTSLACVQDFQAFTQPPTAFPPGPLPPIPLYACPVPNAGYAVNFCPDGTFPQPPSEGRALHPNGNPGKCLDVRGAVFANGTPVQIYDCNGTKAQKWVINRGDTKVRVAGTDFCLDAGSHPTSGVRMKIWKCYDNLPAQAWYYTNDNRIALTGRAQCLDLPNGVLANSNRVQIWKCTDRNTNQIWAL